MLSYRLDLGPDSASRVCPPGGAARLFALYPVEAGFFDAGPDYFTRRDSLPSKLMIFTRSGAGEMRAGGKIIPLPPGTAVVVDCEAFHEYHTVGDRWRFDFAHFDGPGFLGFAPMTLNAPARPEDEAAFGAALRSLQAQGPDDRLRAARDSLALTRLLMWMSETVSEPDVAVREEIARAAAYLDAHLREGASLDALSALTHLSKYHLSRLFKAQVGETPHRYLLTRRVLRAQSLLRGTEMSVSEIASEVGFDAPSSFAACFKAHTGRAPAAYRSEAYRI